MITANPQAENGVETEFVAVHDRPDTEEIGEAIRAAVTHHGIIGD